MTLLITFTLILTVMATLTALRFRKTCRSRDAHLEQNLAIAHAIAVHTHTDHDLAPRRIYQLDAA